MTRMGMALDLNRCVGCHTCATACKMMNNLPNDMWWNRILTDGGDCVDTSGGTYPNNYRRYIPMNCQHCDDPACVKACPVGATYKREEDGIVLQDSDKCIGCRYCMVACPYEGVRQFNWEKPDYYIPNAIGDADAPEHQYNTVEKCTFCYNRLAKDEKPACMIHCPAKARFYGDLDDPNSDVCKAIQGRSTMKLLEEKGTNPNVFYLL